MAHARLTDEDVRQLVTAVLKRRTEGAGFIEAAVMSDFDRDGEPIIRIKARYERRPASKPDPLISALHAVYAALAEQGDERSIILVNEVESERIERDLLVEEDAE